MTWKLIISILCVVFAIVGCVLSVKGKGKLKMIGILAALIFSFAVPFFLSPYFTDVFAEHDVIKAKAIGYTGGFLVFVATLGFLLRDWHPMIGTILLAIFLILGVATIILGIFISKSYFVKLPETASQIVPFFPLG